jgi:CRP-like cAMP-binding protein
MKAFDYLHAKQPLTAELRDCLNAELNYLEMRKSQYLLRTGRVPTSIYFVESGLLKLAYEIDDKSISASFSFEGEICACPGFFSQDRAQYNIQALEDSDVSHIQFHQYRKLIHLFPEFNSICRRLLEECRDAEYKRMRAVWMHPTPARYQWYKQHRPADYHRIPGKYLASYLGMSTVQLSNLKNHPISKK